MLENVLEIGERPEDLVVYAARGKAARDWASYSRIVAALRSLGEDETLVVQSGKPIGVFPTPPDAPLVLMACGNVVGRYATPEYFDDACATAASSCGAGSPPATGSTSASRASCRASTSSCEPWRGSTSAGRSRAGSSSRAGLGGMGAAQPLAITLAGGSGLVVEVDADKCDRSLERGHLDSVTDDLDEALALVASRAAGAASSASSANAAAVYGELAGARCRARRRDRPHRRPRRRPRLLPGRLLARGMAGPARADPAGVAEMARRSRWRAQVQAMLPMKAAGAVVFEDGNNLRVQAEAAGVSGRFRHRRLRGALPAAAVLPRDRPVSLGGP